MISSFTVYTQKLFNKFASVTTSQKRRIIVNYAVGAILFVVALYCFMTRKYIIGTFFGIFSILFSCSRLILMAIINRFNARQLNTYDKYYFYDDKFTVNSFLAGGTPYSQCEHNYSEIESIDFFTTFAYIYLAKGETYIFLRENFKNPEQFDWLLQNLTATVNAKKLGIKYTMPKLSEYLANSTKPVEKAENLVKPIHEEINQEGNKEQSQKIAEKSKKTVAKKPLAGKTKPSSKSSPKPRKKTTKSEGKVAVKKSKKKSIKYNKFTRFRGKNNGKRRFKTKLYTNGKGCAKILARQ